MSGELGTLPIPGRLIHRTATQSTITRIKSAPEIDLFTMDASKVRYLLIVIPWQRDLDD
jgi:hypothetical protein